MTQKTMALVAASLALACAPPSGSLPAQDECSGCDVEAALPTIEECTTLYFSGDDGLDGLECFREISDEMAAAKGPEVVAALANHRDFENAYGLLRGTPLSAWKTKLHEGIPFFVAAEAAILLSAPTENEDVDLYEDVRITAAPDRCIEEWSDGLYEAPDPSGFLNLIAACTSLESNFIHDEIAAAWAEEADAFGGDIAEILGDLKWEHDVSVDYFCNNEGAAAAFAACNLGGEAAWHDLVQSLLVNSR